MAAGITAISYWVVGIPVRSSLPRACPPLTPSGALSQVSLFAMYKLGYGLGDSFSPTFSPFWKERMAD